jgi:hypothetical protein
MNALRACPKRRNRMHLIGITLLRSTLSYFDGLKGEGFAVKPSLPILYFGDTEAYRDSQRRIVTVGKNPSLYEFRMKNGKGCSYYRFPQWDPAKSNLREVLDSYYRTKPYSEWFRSYENVLNGFDASYFPSGSFRFRSLHTDICSPLATDPTWSNLPRNSQDMLFQGGYELWKQLIELLQPDIILVSIPRRLVETCITKDLRKVIEFREKKDGGPRTTPYGVFRGQYGLSSGKEAIVLFGQAAQKPFDLLSDEQKRQIGQKLCLQ